MLGQCPREVEVGLEVPGGEDAAQVGVAAAVDRDEQGRGAGVGGWRRVPRRLERRDLGAQQGGEAFGPRRAVEADGEVEVVAVGERERRVAEFERALDQRLGRGGAEEERAVRAHPQRDKAGHGAAARARAEDGAGAAG